MRSTRELGRFLFDSRLRLKVGLTKNGFDVVLERGGVPVARGWAETFPDAIDDAIASLARGQRRVDAC